MASHHPPFNRRILLGWSMLGLVSACAGQQQQRASLEAATENTTLGPGDIFNLEIVGEPDLPTEYQVAADGTVTLPYIQVVDVAGLEPQEVAEKVRQELIDQKILTNPSVVVSVKEYRSKTVTVLGQVQKPGSFILTPGMTLLEALSRAGGFTSIAQTTRVNLTRTTRGDSKTVSINVESIHAGSEPDVKLQAGDRIYVNERVF